MIFIKYESKLQSCAWIFKLRALVESLPINITFQKKGSLQGQIIEAEQRYFSSATPLLT